MKDYTNKLSIKQWAEDDRPREKLLSKGRLALSNAELIAILISSGTKEESAVDLSKRILASTQDSLIELSKLSIKELSTFKGIGPARAVTITAALELGRRRREAEALTKKTISCSRDAFEVIQSTLADIQYEEFWILLLNRANQVIRKVNISEGGFAGTIADPKKIFKIGLENSASGIILCHNHPSGNLKPSDADLRLTRKLAEAGTHLELPIVDHLIIGDEKYLSFADEGLL
ncbi:MAG: DNA repair protein RadC [Bacteroidota bacterium]|nr:DNA repair protein RadC [Bacteroidota bacterium]